MDNPGACALTASPLTGLLGLRPSPVRGHRHGDHRVYVWITLTRFNTSSWASLSFLPGLDLSQEGLSPHFPERSLLSVLCTSSRSDGWISRPKGSFHPLPGMTTLHPRATATLLFSRCCPSYPPGLEPSHEAPGRLSGLYKIPQLQQHWRVGTTSVRWDHKSSVNCPQEVPSHHRLKEWMKSGKLEKLH